MTTLFTNVKPGDVISSDLINYFLGKLTEFDKRISDLEAGGTTEGQVAITEFDPPNQQDTGQILSIIGKNFAFPSHNNAVTLDDVPVTAFEPDSTGSLLKFTVPTSLKPATGGKIVKVTVTNSKGSSSRLYRILPGTPAVGPPPKITSPTVAADGTLIRVLQPIIITGENFAANPMQNIITFQILTGAGPVIYPKEGQALQIDAAQSNETKIVVTVPDIKEITQEGGSTSITLRVGVGSHVPAAENINVRR